MAIPVSLGVPPFLQFTDNEGIFLAYGKLLTQDWETRVNKPTYQDENGTVAYSNPIILDGIGRTQPIFWMTDKPYYLELRDMDDNLIWSSNTPYSPGAGGGNSSDADGVLLPNLFINSQFRFFSNQSYSPVPNSIPNLANGGWSFIKDGTNATDMLQFVQYTLDDNSAPPPSVYSLRYTANINGVGETIKDIRFTIKDVRSLAGQTISVSGWFESLIATNPSIDIGYIQHFGTGGTPSADNEKSLGAITISAIASQQIVSGIADNLSGKTLGTNGDDYFQIYIRLPLNVAQSIEMVNLYLKRGGPVNGYPYETYEQTLAQIVGSSIPTYNQETQFPDDNSLLFNEYAYDVPMLIPQAGNLQIEWMPAIPVGCSMYWPTEIAPSGWLLCEGQGLLVWSQYNRLYRTFVNTNTWGRPADNATSIVATDTMTITNTQTGVVPAPPTAGTTPFTVTVTTPGSIGFSQVSTVQFKPANVVVAGQYWLFGLQGGTNYYIWYRIDGLGNDPLVAAHTGIRIDISASDSAPQVAAKTLSAFNPLLFSNIDARGMFARVWDNGAGRDPNAALRAAIPGVVGQTVTGDKVGTYEADAFASHTHLLNYPVPPNGTAINGIFYNTTGTGQAFGATTANGQVASLPTVANTGNSETRPKNFYMAMIIKY